MTYAEIASKHSISESTVAYHLKLTITRKQGAPVHPDLLRIRFAV
jgi:DNA-binding CsgD family transcriptional regulator